MGRLLTPDERFGVGNFLVSQHVPRDKVKFYQHWIDRYLRQAPLPDASGDDPEALTKYLDDLGHEKAPWQVKQACEAVRLFLYYRSSQPHFSAVAAIESAPAADPVDIAAWDAQFAELRRIIRVKQLSLQTERTYVSWLGQFRRWVRERRPDTVSSADVRHFLSFLALERQVAAKTQNQAFNAMLFFLRHCLGRDPKDLEGSVRAPERRRLPVVLSRDEIMRTIAHMEEPYALMARITYGCGLRLSECLALRIKDVDFERGVLAVHAGKGNKDRQTVLPESLREPWERHLCGVRRLFEYDRLRDLPGVELPFALERKYPNAGKEWTWFWAFPAAAPACDPRSGVRRRPCLSPDTFRHHFRAALRAAGIAKYATVHTLRHNAELRIMPNGSYMLNTIPLQAA
jgi:integron integrase